MGFILGFLIGLITAIGLFFGFAYWLCGRSNNIAVARFINGIAQALAYRPKSPELLAPDKNGEAMEGARGTRKEKPMER